MSGKRLIFIMKITKCTHVAQLIDPANCKPFYAYNGRIIDGDDIDDLKDSQNYLRIICDNLWNRSPCSKTPVNYSYRKGYDRKNNKSWKLLTKKSGQWIGVRVRIWNRIGFCLYRSEGGWPPPEMAGVTRPQNGNESGMDKHFRVKLDFRSSGLL